MAIPELKLQVGSPTGKSGVNRKRPHGFWNPFNQWWREYFEDHGQRPGIDMLRSWYSQNARLVWKEDDMPTWEETEIIAKGLRPKDKVRRYFQQYRRDKKAAKLNQDDGADLRSPGAVTSPRASRDLAAAPPAPGRENTTQGRDAGNSNPISILTMYRDSLLTSAPAQQAGGGRDVYEDREAPPLPAEGQPAPTITAIRDLNKFWAAWQQRAEQAGLEINLDFPFKETTA